jgi:hypothetical protein
MYLWKSKPKKLHVNVVLLAKERRARWGPVSGANEAVLGNHRGQSQQSRLELGLRFGD